MHIKQDPEDFRVEERTNVQPGPVGDYAFYRLEKRGWTTPDALALIGRRWHIEPRRLAYGGLKDRHAQTLQYISIVHGPERPFAQERISLTYLGRLTRPYRSEDIVANCFDVTLRDMTPQQLESALGQIEVVRRTGVPNYFDDQRFGSVADGGPFMARSLIVGNAEEALRLALTAPYRFDRAAHKREKALLRRLWGDWTRLKELLPRGHARRLADYLCVHPGDFRGAVQRLRPELRGLYLSAYQSHLWNRMLARWLEAHLERDQLVAVPLRLGAVPMPSRLSEELVQLVLPLHSARIALEPDDPRKPFFDAVLLEEGLTQEQLKLKGLREMFFSKGERRALCLPADLSANGADDDKHPGRRKLTLHFALPRGSYATLIVKRVSVPLAN